MSLFTPAIKAAEEEDTFPFTPDVVMRCFCKLLTSIVISSRGGFMGGFFSHFILILLKKACNLHMNKKEDNGKPY